MIPVFEPWIGEEEIEAVAGAVRDGEISGSFGKNIESFEEEFAAYIGSDYGVAVTSGTTALHLAVAAAGIGEGDEILISASTNIASALAAYHNGAVAIPIDVERDTWNLDLDLVESQITPKTRAIMPVHLFGHPVDMDAVVELAQNHDLIVIEDCAESHGATVRGKMTGSFGALSCFSFYANKIITTGEGGMVMTSNPELADRLRLLRNLAFQKPRFLHEEAGFNFRMTGYQAAMGRAQLEKIDYVIEEKRRLAGTYNRLLAEVPGIQTPVERDWARNVYWMYAIVVGKDFGIDRDELATALQKRGIETRTFFCPLNMQPCLQRQTGFRDVPSPVAEEVWRTGMYLPSSITLSDSTITTIVEEIAAAAQL
jgi:perosamine synthetase